MMILRISSSNSTYQQKTNKRIDMCFKNVGKKLRESCATTRYATSHPCPCSHIIGSKKLLATLQYGLSANVQVLLSPNRNFPMLIFPEREKNVLFESSFVGYHSRLHGIYFFCMNIVGFRWHNLIQTICRQFCLIFINRRLSINATRKRTELFGRRIP